VLALLALGAKRKAEQLATDCEVTAVYSDGRVEPRECYTAEDFGKKGTKGRFESCTA